MTRENKLALVVGFGLMLFVGILVSDHFSAQRFDPATVAQATPGDAITVIQLDEVGEQSLAWSIEPVPMQPIRGRSLAAWLANAVAVQGT